LRTRAHVLADLSINHVERQVLLCAFAADRVQHDYGYDLTVTTYNGPGEVEPGAVYLQVKATDHLSTLAGGQTISWPVSRRDLRLWLAEVYPVILVVYDGRRNRAYWAHIQAALAGRGTADLFTGETIRVRVPTANRLNRHAVRLIARTKNDLHRQLRGKGP
jgi:hypothetical protein